LDQTTNSLGAAIDREQAEDLPLNGRNWANLDFASRTISN
jgi:hypothetical protein